MMLRDATFSKTSLSVATPKYAMNWLNYSAHRQQHALINSHWQWQLESILFSTVPLTLSS